MASVQARPKCLALFLGRRSCISQKSNTIVEQVRKFCSAAPKSHWLLDLASSGKPNGVLGNKVHLKYRPCYLVRCQLFYKSEDSFTSVSVNSYHKFSTKPQISEKGQSNNPAICKSKATPSLEREILAMGMWLSGFVAVGAAIAGVLIANTDFFLTKPEFASLEYLENAELKTTAGDEKTLKAGSLWERSGAVIMAEAAELSSLKAQLDKLGVPLYAVVKENIGTEIKDFRPHFAGDIFLDERRVFYGPIKRKMGLLGLIRLGVLQNFLRAWQSGYQGNMNGEGFVLGGVFVIGPGKQGIIFEHREIEFGDKVSKETVLEAAKKIVIEK